MPGITAAQSAELFKAYKAGAIKVDNSGVHVADGSHPSNGDNSIMVA